MEHSFFTVRHFLHPSNISPCAFFSFSLFLSCSCIFLFSFFPNFETQYLRETWSCSHSLAVFPTWVVVLQQDFLHPIYIYKSDVLPAVLPSWLEPSKDFGNVLIKLALQKCLPEEVELVSGWRIPPEWRRPSVTFHTSLRMLVSVAGISACEQQPWLH